MLDKKFYAVCLGFVLGVLFSTFIFVDFFITILLIVISFSVLLFFSFISKNKWGKIGAFFVFAIFLGILRFNFAEVNIPKFLESQDGSSVELSGIVTSEPEIRENNQRFVVSSWGFISKSLETEFFPTKVKILISTDFNNEYRYGDEVIVSGKLKKPENFITDYGKEFDYVNYLKKDGIIYAVSFAKLQIISRGNGSKVQEALFFVKEKFLEKINFSIKQPESLLMGGLILGDKASFSQSQRQNFINTGTIHIIALSGYNVTIVAEWIMKLFSFLPINFGISAGIFAIILFIFMTGASSTAIRAGIMATLALVARATGRNYDVARALILAGVFMIFFNPMILVYDVSFQLSFIATVAVIFLAPRIEKYFTWVTKSFGLRDIVSVTSAAYIFVMPFILYKMGTFSIVAIPANFLVLPLIPITMAFGFFTGFVGLVSGILAFPFGIISYLLLHYELFVINLLASFPFSVFTIPNFPLFFYNFNLCLFYLSSFRPKHQKVFYGILKTRKPFLNFMLLKNFFLVHSSLDFQKMHICIFSFQMLDSRKHKHVPTYQVQGLGK